MNHETAPTHRALKAPELHRKRRASRCRFARRNIGRPLSVCFLSLCLLPSAVSAGQLFTTDGVNVRSGPSSDSSIYFAIPAGTEVTKTGQTGNWIAVNVDGVQGYIYNRYLSENSSDYYTSPDYGNNSSSGNSSGSTSSGTADSYINSTEVNLRKKSNSHCKVLAVLEVNEPVSVLSVEGNWSRIRRENGQEGYVYSIYLGDNKPDYSGGTHSTVLSREDCIDAFRSAAISYAEGRLGDTYSQERRDTDGYADCSSLVRDAFQNASGVSIGNTTSSQADTMNNYFYSIDQITDATPGDLLYHLSGDHHTGIYLGNGQVLHASQNAGTVKISSYNADSSYWEYGCNAAAYCYDAGQ